MPGYPWACRWSPASAEKSLPAAMQLFAQAYQNDGGITLAWFVHFKKFEKVSFILSEACGNRTAREGTSTAAYWLVEKNSWT